MNNALTTELQRQVHSIAISLTGSAASTHDDVMREIDALQTIELHHSVSQLGLPTSAAMQAEFAEAATHPHSVLRYLTDAHDALEGMSDSDIDHFETDEEEAEGAPAQFAARRVMQALHMLSTMAIMAPAALNQAAHEVLAERARQIRAEGWTPERDDAYEGGELAIAAACYAQHGGVPNEDDAETPNDWPWSDKWWKPADKRRNLVKAGALILADIERIDRAAAKQPKERAQ